LHLIFSFQYRTALPVPAAKVTALLRQITATGTGTSKNLRAMIKERVSMTAIRLTVIEVKENCGAILKIAPLAEIKVTTRQRNIVREQTIYGAISEIAPEKKIKLIT